MSSNFVEKEIQLAARCIKTFQTNHGTQLEELVTILKSELKLRRQYFFLGNGGSASDCNHIANEMLMKYRTWRSPICAISLTSNVSVISGAANDDNFEKVFSRQLEALAEKGDNVFALSTSGSSTNVVAALHTAKSMGLRTIALVGPSYLSELEFADHHFTVDSCDPGRIQEIHMLVLHIISAALESELVHG